MLADKYPQHQRLRQIEEEYGGALDHVQGFYDWLVGGGLRLAVYRYYAMHELWGEEYTDPPDLWYYNARDEIEPEHVELLPAGSYVARLEEIRTDPERLMAEYWGIDHGAYKAETEAMYQEVVIRVEHEQLIEFMADNAVRLTREIV